MLSNIYLIITRECSRVWTLFDRFESLALGITRRLLLKYKILSIYLLDLISLPPDRIFLARSPFPLLLRSLNLNFSISINNANHPPPQPPMHMASTNSHTHVFRRWHWSRCDQTTSPFLLDSVHRPADHLVSRQSRLGCAGRCYAGTCEYSRLTLNNRAAIPRLCELSGTRSLAVASVLVSVASNDAVVVLVVAFACVRITPDDWIFLIIRVCVRVGVH